MIQKEHFHAIVERRAAHCGFWHGNPNPESVEKLQSYFQVKDDFELGLKLGSTCRWVMPEEYHAWTDPARTLFDEFGGRERVSLSEPGVFAEAGDVAEIEQFHWPDPARLDFTETLAEIERTVAAGQAVLSGMWSCFYHKVCNFFGMEDYFIKMHTTPAVVDAVTRHVVDFYLEANKRLFELAGNRIDALFMGNDFGSQLDLLVSPEHFDRFILPHVRELAGQARHCGLRVVCHSCGAIDRVIPRLIDTGVEVLHPIQALARGMDAETLSKKYNGKIVFMGGVDTQHILPFATADKVRDEVRRLKDLFGSNYIVSPSHESLLPNVPPENLAAMAAAAAE
jgi:uroporphyrinogen decarboxylase